MWMMIRIGDRNETLMMRYPHHTHLYPISIRTDMTTCKHPDHYTDSSSSE